MLPNFLIIGAPRAGTTWLAKNLREHPEVFMPAEKELHYFDRHFEKGTAYYERFFDGAKGFKAVGEATPEYLYLPEMTQRIATLLPDCKLIVSLRNPVDRVYSRYWNAKAKYAENRKLSFEEKLRTKPLFLEEGKYYTHLCRFLQFYPKDRILLLLYDDIMSQPSKVLRTAFNYLGVSEDFASSRLDERINAAADKPRLARSRPLYYVHKVLGRLGLKSTARRVADVNIGALPPMDPKTRQWLANDIYAEENARLQELTGIDVSGWR